MSKQPEYVTESSEHYYLSMLPQATKEELRRRHGNSKRHYHTWEHVRELFRLLETIDEALECLPAVILACAFHDVVYDATRKDNEVRSAALMRKHCKGMELLWVERADAMIMATQNHQLPPHYGPRSDAAYFLDMDMAILGSQPARYTEYARQVRMEYAHLGAADYRAGRAEFLRGALAKAEAGALYNTDWGRHLFQGQAQMNMQRELAQLETIDEESTAVPLEG